MVKKIDLARYIKFVCFSQSFMKTPGEIVSLVKTSRSEVQMICYNQAANKVTTIHNYGRL